MAERTMKSSTISMSIDSLFDRGEELIEMLGCQVFILVSQDGIWSSYMGSEFFLKEFSSSGLKMKSQDVLRKRTNVKMQHDFHFVEDAGRSQQTLYRTQQRTYHINNKKSSKHEDVETPPCSFDTLARASSTENMTGDCCIVTNTMNSCLETNRQNDEKDVKREQTEEIQMECFSKEKLVKESYLKIDDEGETATNVTIKTEANDETSDTGTIPDMADAEMILAKVYRGNVSLLPGNHGCNEEKREKSPDDHGGRVFQNVEIKTEDTNIESYLKIDDEGETATNVTIKTEANDETSDTETIPDMADAEMILAKVDRGNVALLPGNQSYSEEMREKSPNGLTRRVFENVEIKTKDTNIESEEGAVDNPDKSKLSESIKANAAHRHHLGKNYSEEDFRLHKEKIETMFKESNESKPHLCERCGLSFKNLNGLEVHQQKALCSERKCQFCGMCFPIKAWQEHLLEKHVAKVTIYGCHICERKFICYHSHRDHLKVHESERNSLICNVCGETFNRFSTLKLHQLAHTGTELKCEYCEYTTFVKHRLKSHMKRHFERGKLECKFCGKHLNNGVCLSSHIRRFHIKSKHQCSDCKKEFSFLPELNNHRARHHQDNVEIKTKDTNIESEEGAVDNPDKSKLSESIKANAAHRHHLGKNYSEEDFRLHKEKIETMFKESNESKPHLCERCGLSFKNLNGLEVHQQKALCSERKCQFCGMCFPIKAWQEHLLEKHVAKVTIYGCHICERKFICYHSHRDHLKVHESERNSLICNVCGETFNRFSTLKLHQLAHKGTELKCEYCEYTTFVKHRLKSHMKRHFERGKLECKFCGKHLNNGVCLSSHIRRFHIKSKHQCSDCKKEFSFLRELNNHRARHHQDNVASFICEKCGKGFLSKILLNLHLKKTHNEHPVQCEVCGKQFKYKSSLQVHLKLHNKYRHQIHPCEFCPRKFMSRSEAKVHMRSIHSDERPYQCQFCEYSCKLKGNLTRHTRTHNK